MQRLLAQRDATTDDLVDRSRIKTGRIPDSALVAASLENGRDAFGSGSGLLLHCDALDGGLLDVTEQRLELSRCLGVEPDPLEGKNFDCIFRFGVAALSGGIDGVSRIGIDLALSFERAKRRHNSV